MKIRNGFVSNSSSSSFIIAVEKGFEEKCPTCGKGGTDFENLIDYASNVDCDTSIDYAGVEDVIASIEQNISDWENSSYTEQMRGVIKRIKELENTHKIYDISVAYSNDLLLEILRNDNKITILYGED